MKRAHELSAEQRARLESWAARRGFRLVVLFGSRARGEARPDSDFDVAVWPSRQEKPLERLTWVCELEDIIGGEAQLAIVREIDPVLGWEIGRDGKPWVEAEEGIWARERLRLWHLYNDSLPFRRLLRRQLADFAAEVRRGA
ncbi:MAG TPA: nucleotidyltransferase domain-containing protein [Thermoanaerobaculia bacterium]|nr:nucleotidyltransferase domain-containing protein [Thermoanaerobaculia bacterium]